MKSSNYNAILHVYNEEKHLTRVIKAIRGQTKPPAFIFVVDDGSIDQTPTILHELEVSHIHLPRGQPGEPYMRRVNAFNLAVKCVRKRHPETPYILKVDGDIEIPPNYAETILQHFTNRIAAISGVSTQYKKINSIYNGAVMYRTKTLPEAQLVNGWDMQLINKLISRGYQFKVVKNISYTDLRPTRFGRPRPTRYLLNVLSRMKSEVIGAVWRVGCAVGESWARKNGIQSGTHQGQFAIIDRETRRPIAGYTGQNLQVENSDHRRKNVEPDPSGAI